MASRHKYYGKKKILVPKWKVFRAKDPMMSVFMWGVNHTTSLTAIEPEVDPQEGSGNFFVSYDRMFVIKLIDSEAVAELHSILSRYHSYVVDRQGKTLLPQYLGLYRVTVEGDIKYFLVMRNIFGPKYMIHKKFDLKGSTVQRQASEKERAKELPTLKDNDFLEEHNRLYVPVDVKGQLLEILQADTQFLTKLHLMDYSLLVGIHDVERGKEEMALAEKESKDTTTEEFEGADPEDELAPTPPDSPVPSVAAFNLDDEFFAIVSSNGKNSTCAFSLFLGSPKKYIYFVGLVDILTYYGVKKKTASAAKALKYGDEAEHISTVKPEQYAKRLVEFIDKNVAYSGQ